MKKLSECTVLIVDDTEENIDILVEALGDDYEIAVAMSGESAIEYMNDEFPDIVLLDILMPNMNGYEVCTYMKEHQALEDIPVVFLSAMSDTESKRKGFKVGAVDYITKPFDIYEVKARVHTHLSLTIAKKELSMQNEILELKVQERTKELMLTQEAMIEAIGYLAEYRDPETGAHIKRTKNYVKVVAEKLRELPKYRDKLTTEIIYYMHKLAPLHDIGKIGIRDEILLKPGKLTEEEYEEMKMHTIIGYNAIYQATYKLGDDSFLKYAMIFSKYHHEKYDGTGYPNKLSGEEIPLAGRILAIADVYDALISERVYKPAFPHEKALEIIVKESGKHFDPEIVQAFMEINDQIHYIAESVKDEEKEREENHTLQSEINVSVV